MGYLIATKSTHLLELPAGSPVGDLSRLEAIGIAQDSIAGAVKDRDTRKMQEWGTQTPQACAHKDESEKDL